MLRPTPAPWPLTPALWAVAAVLLCAATCRSRPSADEAHQALIHHDLGVEALRSNDFRSSLGEFQKALDLDPDLDLSHNAIGVLFHVQYREHDKAMAHYRRALEVNPKFTDARVNLANVYLDLGRHTEAVPLYQEALADMLYKTPYIAENNLGWALYKTGKVDLGIQRIRAALVYNPKFCLGHRNLGMIYTDLKQIEKACDALGQYVKHCAKEPEAHYRMAKCLLAAARQDEARKSLETCVSLGENTQIGPECQHLLELMK